MSEDEGAFVDHLYQIQNEYGHAQPTCIGGSINKLVETLDDTHKDVHIVRLNAEIFTRLTQEVVRDRFNARTPEERAQLQQKNNTSSNAFFDECRRVILERAMSLRAELRNDGLYVREINISVLTHEQYIQATSNEVLAYAIPEESHQPDRA